MTQSVVDKIKAFQSLFGKWNEKINLSAASTLAEIDEHVRDCLPVVPFLQDRKTVLDVGAGGGFPVVVAAISLPDVQFTALEPVRQS